MATATLTIHCADRRQRMDGFGTQACNQEAPTDAEADELCGTLGLSLFMAACWPGPPGVDGKPTPAWSIAPGSDEPGSNASVCDLLTFPQKVHARGARLFWPHWFMGDGSWINRVPGVGPQPGDPASWRDEFGRLRPTNYADYAHWIEKLTVDAYSRGLTLAAICPLGEPDLDQVSYQASSARMDPADVVAYLKDANGGVLLRSLMQAIDPAIKILIPEVSGWAPFASYVSAIKADSAAYAVIDGWCVHDYGGDSIAVFDPGHVADGKILWQTETWSTHQSPFDPGIGDAITRIKRLHRNVLDGGASAWLHFLAWRTEAWPPAWLDAYRWNTFGIDVWENAGLWGRVAAGKPRAARAWALGNVAKAAPVGSYRVGFTSSGFGAYCAAAFASDTHVGASLVNDSPTEPLVVSGSVLGAPPALQGFAVVRTSDSEGLASVGYAPLAGGAFSVTLPPLTVVSLVAADIPPPRELAAAASAAVQARAQTAGAAAAAIAAARVAATLAGGSVQARHELAAAFGATLDAWLSRGADAGAAVQAAHAADARAGAAIAGGYGFGPILKKWNGAAYVPVTLKRWTGTRYEAVPLKRN